MDRPNLIDTTKDARRLDALLMSASGRASPIAPLLKQELARAGAALLDLSVGSVIDGPVPGGRMARVRVVVLPYQPQSAARHVN